MNSGNIRSNRRGASFIEVVLTLPIFIFLALGIFDLARLTWTRTSVRSALSYAVKKAGSDKNLLAKFNNPDGTFADYEAYKASRENVINEAMAKLNPLAKNPSISFFPISHLDEIAGDHLVKDSAKPVGVLPAATGAIITDSTGKENFVSNLQVCPDYSDTESNKNTLGQSSDSFNCEGIAKPSGQTIDVLSIKYPLDVLARFKMQTAVLGTVEMTVSVAGFINDIALVNAATQTPFYPFPPTIAPTFTPTIYITPFYPTFTPTIVPPTATPTNTPVPPTATPTKTPVPPTATPTKTPVPPTATPTKTNTPTATSTATNTPTNTPTNTLTNTPTITTTATPTNTATATPTKTASPSPTGSCKDNFVYKVNVKMDGKERNEGKPIFEGKYPACLKGLIDACGAGGEDGIQFRPTNGTLTNETKAKHAGYESADDCIVVNLLVKPPYGYPTSSISKTFATNFGWSLIGPGKKNILKQSADFAGADTFDYGLTSDLTYKGQNLTAEYSVLGTTYLDNNCTLIPNPGYFCESFTASSITSPVSLIWEDGISIKDFLAFSNFPLDPKIKGKWFDWRASAKTPLLVFNPENKKVVDSASMLFGNFTFGEEFENGYKALSKLDIDNNGKLSGEELKHIMLWFDNNSDGVTQDGELKTLTEYGVVSLFTAYDHKDEATGDIHAKAGYERIVDGKTIIRPSVDWFSESYDSKMQAISEKSHRSNAPTSDIDSSADKAARTHLVSTTDIAGAWNWVVDGESPFEGIKPQGIITFKTKGNGITGHSFIETSLPANPTNAAKVIVTYQLKGEKISNIKGEETFKFQMGDANGANTVSTATLSLDGKTLTGTSTLALDSAKNAGSVTYTWKANRY